MPKRAPICATPYARMRRRREKGRWDGIRAAHPNTRLKIVLEDGGFIYSSDSYADDLPYWVRGPKGPHLIVPYSLDANDMRFINAQGFPDGESFFVYLRDTFDLLYDEGLQAPKMMSVGLHCRLAGRPGRAAGLARFLDHIAKFERVWAASRLEIARHWHREHLALAADAPLVA